MTVPTVSVIIPCFNRAGSLQVSIQSALAQDVPVEVIVVDDHSTEDIKAVVRECGDQRVRYIRLPANAGPSAARNRAIETSCGEWIALLDNDDRWMPDKLSAQLKFMADIGGDACSTGYRMEYPRPFETVDVIPPSPEDARDVLINGNRWGLGSTLLARKSVFDEVGLFAEDLRRIEDTEWLLRFMRAKPFAVLGDVLCTLKSAPLSMTRAGGDVFVDSAETFKRYAARELELLSRDERRTLSARDYDRAAWAYFAERKWGSGFRHLRLSMRCQAPRSLGNVLTYIESITQIGVTAWALRLKQALKVNAK